MDELEDTVKELKDREFIRRVFIYYSGHYYNDEGKGFQTDEHSFKSKGEFGNLINTLKREIILVTDCCFSEKLKDICPDIRIQIGASRSEETAEFEQSGSVFTGFFIHSLKGKSQGSPCPLSDNFHNFSCDICKNYNPEEERIGFISVLKMFKNIREHMKEFYKNGPHKSCSPFLSVGNYDDDCFIGYHIDKKTEIKFGIEDNTESKQPGFVISELPKKMKDLQTILFKEILKQKKLDVDSHQGVLDEHSDVITVIVREGPREEHKTELLTVAKVSDAVIQKFDIICSVRPIQELNKGKVGMFLTEVTTGNVVGCVGKINKDELKVQRCEREIVITIDWEKIQCYSIVETVRERGPAETWLKDTLIDICNKHGDMEAKELVMTIPFGECNSVCEMAKNFLVLEIRK